jgi:hypothetical protein
MFAKLSETARLSRLKGQVDDEEKTKHTRIWPKWRTGFAHPTAKMITKRINCEVRDFMMLLLVMTCFSYI